MICLSNLLVGLTHCSGPGRPWPRPEKLICTQGGSSEQLSSSQVQGGLFGRVAWDHDGCKLGDAVDSLCLVDKTLKHRLEGPSHLGVSERRELRD